MYKVAVVILNWNGKAWLEKFLPSVTEYSRNPDYEVVVVDNGSTDDSLTFLTTRYPQVRQVTLPVNHGFAEGYNLALKQVEAQYYLLLNSDIEVTPQWLEPLVAHMDTYADVGACMPKVRAYHQKNTFEYAGAAGGFIDKYGYPFCRGRVLNVIEEDKGQYNTTIDVFWATGACMLVRSELYHRLGGFDADFFAHMEEIDFCWRVKQQGYRISCVPQSVVYHVGGATLSYNTPRKLYLNHRNSLYMLYKNLPRKAFRRRMLARMLLDGLSGVMYLFSGQLKYFIALLEAHRGYYRHKAVLKEKRRKLKAEVLTDVVDSIYPNSLVWKFFIARKRTYASLMEKVGVEKY